MSRRSSFPYRKVFLICAFLLFLFGLGGSISLSLKSKVISAVTMILPFKSHSNLSSSEEEIEKLRSENFLLRESLEHLAQQIKLFPPNLETIPAHVIYRSPESWNSTCWIDVGEIDHITKGDPVIAGQALVGIIEHVDKNKSLVKWITDPSVTPSVRVKRQEGEKISYLAKGYLKGGGEPLWRSRGRVLEGTGFNYDFADEYGEHRDLRAQGSEPLIMVGDLLVTTGMDGLFPPNLEVAIVTEIKTLREGDYFYELKAKPAAGNMEELGLVFVVMR